MLALISIYAWTIVAGAVAAGGLALVGAQLATRDRAMQTLCLGQGAIVGVLLAIGLVQTFELDSWVAIGPLVVAFIFSALTTWLTDALATREVASRNTLFALVFSSLLAIGSLVSALFPALESHMAQIYFGDLATLTSDHAVFLLLLSVACVLYLWRNGARISNESFEIAIYGEAKSGKTWFAFITLLLLCVSVQMAGFLFTVALLFIPTTILSRTKVAGLRSHLTFCGIIGVLASLTGFLISLRFTRLPTVPTIVVSALFFSMMVGTLMMVFGRAGRRVESLVPMEEAMRTT